MADKFGLAAVDKDWAARPVRVKDTESAARYLVTAPSLVLEAALPRSHDLQD